ncbi:hypothetical protein FEM48_Zijuj02G0116600 [Ziziphus jujuba var. spinosa]|uniref:Uncharacterized protein n=1 Tax=Ziziphus jujuba var. spinosa TaxID=714518 RepID=A0A978VVI6_ZIZJJ|nr:hypothetical protein FEM48_Zijuj02G0116600 [Ziziphus jujuba var. spinosa]
MYVLTFGKFPRQKQYFEQRRRQQKYNQQPAKLKSDTDGVDIYKQHKEHRSLDVLNLLNLSANAQECKSASPIGQTKDIGVTASTIEYDITMDPPEILFSAAKSVEIKETRTPLDAKSPKKVSSTAPDSNNNAFNGVDSAPDQWNTASEKLFSVLDLLGDDGLNSNTEENPVPEAHVAFSVEGLGKVGMETPVHSPQQPYRTFSYGCSPRLKDARQQKSSKNLNSQLDDLDCEVDAVMQDINLPFSSSCLDFSMGIVDPLSSPKEKSFTVRDKLHLDNHTAASSFPDSFFDERVHDVTCKRQNDGNCADNLKFGGYDMSDFAFEGPCLPIRRPAPKVTDKFDILGSSCLTSSLLWSSLVSVSLAKVNRFWISRGYLLKCAGTFMIIHCLCSLWFFGIDGPTASYSKHQTSEFDHVFATSDYTRHQTVGRSFDFTSVTSQADQFCFGTEDATDNFSLRSEESSSSCAVSGWTADNLLSHSSSRPGRRKHENAFSGSGDKYGIKKTFVKERQYKGRDSIQQGNVMNGSEKYANMLNQSYPKPSPFLQEKLGPKDIWSFEEGCTTDDIYPGSSSFNQNSGTKHPFFGSKFSNEDPFGACPSEKLHFSAKSSLDGFEPVANSPSGSYISEQFALNKFPILSKPDFPLHSDLRGMPLDSLHAAGSHCETPSPSSSAQESFSKDVEHKEKLRSVVQENFQLGKNILTGNEDLLSQEVATDASNSKENVSECKGTNVTDPTLSESVNTTSFPKDAEDTSPSAEIPDKFESIKEKKECLLNTFTVLPETTMMPKFPILVKRDVEDIGPERKTASKQKSEFDNSCQVVMLQSYVFQLLCVQKILKEASTNCAAKKL